MSYFMQVLQDVFISRILGVTRLGGGGKGESIEWVVSERVIRVPKKWSEWVPACLWREASSGEPEGCEKVEGDLGGTGATDLNQDAQDSQALRPRSRLTQALVGVRIIVDDVQLREGRGNGVT